VSLNVLSFVQAAEEIVVVTTPEPTAITDAYGIIKAIASQSTDKTIRLVVNRCASVSEGKRVAQRIINIAGQFLNIKVESLALCLMIYRYPSRCAIRSPFWSAFQSPRLRAAWA
jgi:flagellar biosynthesis protein FlhG